MMNHIRSISNQTEWTMRTERRGGFTLIEILLSVSIAAAILAGLGALLFLSLGIKEKAETMSEVELTGMLALAEITQTIRNAEAVVGPLPGGTSATLTLDVPELPRDPTVYTNSGGELRISEGGSPAVSLTGPRVVASNLVFQNLSRPGTRGTVKITFTLGYANQSGRAEFTHSRTFFGSATLR